MTCLVLALQLAFPVIAIEIISEMGFGVMMRVVPQINIFSVGIQIKLFVGFIVLVALAPALGGYFNHVYETMFTNLGQLMQRMASG
jgi:flagellar biosynthetic protein FliR